ncbi:MAG: flippase-like domain-containing protein [Prevotellaceae bacterium]|nr:flippase-like domain-containing protein [Prevotellaceae bacterium]
MKSKTLKIVNYLFFLALAVVLMYFCFKGVKFEDLVEELKSADYTWVLLSIVVGMAANVFRALRWRMLIKPVGYNPSAINTYHAVMIGYLVNFALPRVGEITRCAVLRKTDKAPVDVLLGTVVTERIIDMLCLLASISLVFILQYDFFGTFLSENVFSVFSSKLISSFSYMVWQWIGLALLLVIGGLVLLYMFRRELLEFSAVKKIKNIPKGILNGLKSIFRIRNLGLFLFYTLATWACYWLTSYLIMFAIPATAGLTAADALFLMVMGSLGWVAPVQGGFGAYHFMVTLGLGLYGIASEQGVIFATISHESQAISMIFFGFISLIAVFFTNRKNKKQLESIAGN